MNLAQQYRMLVEKQMAFRDGVEMLEATRAELAVNRGIAELWGNTAVVANVSLIGLNCIVNALELKPAVSAYEALVRALYAKFSKGGTRVDGPAAEALALLKSVILGELKRKALTQYIPGVNILIGLAEDSLAAIQVSELVVAGQREGRQLAADMDHRIALMKKTLTSLGVQRGEVMDRLEKLSRTA